METSRATPPAGAVILFSGQRNDLWQTPDGRPAPWKVEGGFLEVVPGSGDLVTRPRFDDFFLHLEFRCPYKPKAQGQERGNSGVFLQGRYELQILDSYGVDEPDDRECGAIYRFAPPLVNASRPAAVWQTYEVIFRAPRNGDAARATVLHNGQAIHNNLSLTRPTPGGLDADARSSGPILLQDHGDAVAFRRIWIVPLTPR